MQIKHKHVSQPTTPVIPPPQIIYPIIRPTSKSESHARNIAIGTTRDLTPALGFEVELPEIVQPGEAGVATKDVHFVADNEGGVVLTSHGLERFLRGWRRRDYVAVSVFGD